MTPLSYTPPPPPSLNTLSTLPALSHLTLHDRALFHQFGFGPHRPIPYPIVHHAFEAHARSQPQAIAVEHYTQTCHRAITYLELDVRANRLARRLREDCAIQTGLHRVCVVARRSIEFVAAIVGVLKAGAQYVPVDGVTVTDKTLLHILRDARPKVVLVMEEYVSRVRKMLGAGEEIQVVGLEAAMAEDERVGRDESKVEDTTKPTDGCYVIYTSGTTGTPKGVDVRHNGVANVICGPPGNVQMAPGMRVAQLLNIAFDMGAWEVLSCLYNGCTLCLRGNTSKEWVALMKTVHVVISTPSILARHDPAEYPNLKEVIVGGEFCPQALADAWASAGIHFHNCCGPTEISICNTVQPHRQPSYPLSIGTPLPNTSLYILDPHWEPPSSFSPHTPPHPAALPIGSPGLMYVGGLGPSRGYLNLPSRTRDRWLPDPFRPDVPGAVMFNTGDLGRWRLEDGQLDHLGRVDEQVKVKGFRVELDGVGAAMREAGQYPGMVGVEAEGRVKVSAAQALLINDELWGFLTPPGVDLPLIKEGTGAIQPYYAVPTRWVVLEAFPMTRNGKVDKRGLRDMAEAELPGGRTPLTPSSVPTTPIPKMSSGAVTSSAGEMARAFPPPPPMLYIPPYGVRNPGASANATTCAPMQGSTPQVISKPTQLQTPTKQPPAPAVSSPTHPHHQQQRSPLSSPPPPHWTASTLEYQFEFPEHEVVAQTQSVQV